MTPCWGNKMDFSSHFKTAPPAGWPREILEQSSGAERTPRAAEAAESRTPAGLGCLRGGGCGSRRRTASSPVRGRLSAGLSFRV